MRIVTWNLNSIRPRLSHLLGFLRAKQPDIVLLQETKVQTEAFPFEQIEELGYQCAVAGQKTYNGVAILSKYPLEVEETTLPGDVDDAQARYIEAVASLEGSAIRVASVYVPNGQEVGSEKFTYKLGFLDRLIAHASALLAYEETLVIGGDYNIAPTDADAYDPKGWKDKVLCHPDERSRFRTLLNAGLYDAYRTLHPEEPAYSWWDYRGGGFEHDKGMRIDHLLLSPEAVDRLESCVVERDERGREKPSDHAPVVCTLAV